MQTERIY